MKQFSVRSPWHKRSSFTLVELLVVMAIIAILIAILMPALSLAIKSAKRARAATVANGIQTAALQYYTDYSVYPVPGGTTTDWTNGDTSSCATAWQNLICSLCGNIHPSAGTVFTPTSSTPTNSRGTAFLTLKSSDVDSSDAPLNPLPTGSEIYFNIAIDSDYDGVLGSSASAAKLPNFLSSSYTATGGTSTAGVAVWANCNGSTIYTNANWWVHTF